MTSLFSHEVHSQLQMCALPWRRAFNYYKIYKYGEKTKLLYKNICIQYMNLQDERHKLTQRLCTGYLDGHAVPQNCTSITKLFLRYSDRGLGTKKL